MTTVIPGPPMNWIEPDVLLAVPSVFEKRAACSLKGEECVYRQNKSSASTTSGLRCYVSSMSSASSSLTSLPVVKREHFQLAMSYSCAMHYGLTRACSNSFLLPTPLV